MNYPRGRFFITFSELFRVFISIFTTPRLLFKESDPISFFRERFQFKNVHLVPSYRIGLYLALKALNLKKDDEVLLTPITIPDTVNSILLNNLTPVFIDHDLETHNTDIESLKRMVTGRTKVVIITYLSGIIHNILEIRRFCKDHNIILIEDFSQAYGSKIDRELAGNIGDIGIGSLSSGKTISSLFGGVINCKNDALSTQIEKEISKHLKSSNQTQRAMLLFQLFDNFKITFFCSKYIFSFFTIYALKIMRCLSPSSYNKIEKTRTIARLVNKDIFFIDSDKRRLSYPHFFFHSISLSQKSLLCSMFHRLENGNLTRRRNFKILLDVLSPQITEVYLPKGLLCIEANTYYHIPLRTPVHMSIIQDELLKLGVDVGTYGLPQCNELQAFKDFRQDCPNTPKLKTHTIFIPIFENHSKSDVIRLAKNINLIYSKYKNS